MTSPEKTEFKENNIRVDISSNSEGLENQFCPYLGLKFDPKSWMGYPSPLNYCHRVKPLAVPRFEHQRNYCLTENYIDCPIVYGGPGQRMPKTIRSQSDRRSTLKRIIRIEVLVGLLLTSIILGAIFWNQITEAIPQIGNNRSNKAQIITTTLTTMTSSPPFAVSPTFTSTATLENSPTPTHTPIPSTETPSPPSATMESPVLALETPIGQDIQFIIHEVIPGESLEAYARDYNTTVEAIRAVNYNLPSFLPLDWIVVIPLNTNDVSDIPLFEPFEITQIVTVEALADLLSVDLTELRRYNRIPSGYTLSPGEWILIPRETSKP